MNKRYLGNSPSHLSTRRPATAFFQRQAGVALITVLLIVFLASVAAVSLASVQQLIIRRSTLLLHQEQARLYTLGAEQWAAAILKRDLQRDRQTNNPMDSLNEDWAKLPPSLPIEGGSLSGRILDLQGRFNLNSLLPRLPQPNPPKPDPNDQEKNKGNLSSDKPPETPLDDTALKEQKQQVVILQRLLGILELPDADIVNAIVDWIDQDQEPLFPDGAEDGEYVLHDPPYMTANRPLTSISELRLIKGIDKTAYEKLAPYVCALPLDNQASTSTKININTATAPVLIALGIDPMRAEALVEDLKKQGINNVDTFLQSAGLELEFKERLDVKSNYFLVQIEARVGDGRATLNSILKRSEDNVHVLMRSFGNEN